MAYSVDKLVELAQKGCTQDEAALGSLGKSAGNVSTALKELIDYISHGMGQGGGQYDEVCEAILAAHDNFFSSVGNPGQMVKQAQGLAQATSELIKALQVCCCCCCCYLHRRKPLTCSPKCQWCTSIHLLHILAPPCTSLHHQHFYRWVQACTTVLCAYGYLLIRSFKDTI